MKRKLLALILALSVVFSLVAPAAAQTADGRLAAVTAKVKKTLDLDTEAYKEFYGNLDENVLAPMWYLEWYGEGGTLSVSATEEGKITNYRLWEESDSVYRDGFAPAFPAGSRDSARKAAEKFLKKVLTRGESFTMEDSGTDRLNATTYRFSGEILLNGLPAGLTYSVAVRCEDNTVTSFYRDDLGGRIVNGVPSAYAAVKEAAAKKTLRETLELRLEYVLAEEGGSKVVLRYLPEYGDNYYVDAATGVLVNLVELARDVAAGGSGADNGAMKDSVTEEKSESLTEAEQAGAQKLAGVLSKTSLDGKVRAISALGLESYTLSTVNYTVDQGSEKDSVTATLRYGKQVEGSAWRRTVTVDAKTGELIRVSSSGWLPEENVERTVDHTQAQEKAEAFLQAQCAGQYAKTALYDSYDAAENDESISHSFTYSQKENGYFFADNSIYVGVDATDGSVSSYNKYFDDEVTFASAEGIITAGQALDAWLDTYTVTLRYVQVPTAVDYSKPEYKALMDYGISYLYKLVLGYTLEREDYLLGIDAATGKPVESPWSYEETSMTYSDLNGHWAKSQVERLARYGVGYTGGQFRPDSALTQLDLIALLASTEGYTYDSAAESAADSLYEFAYNLGLLKREERADSKVMTRAETVKLVLDAMGYGPVARLEGIFCTKFADDSAIPADCYGYVALGQGLGMINGSGGSFRPNDAATRAQAAVMLYNLMDR